MWSGQEPRVQALQTRPGLEFPRARAEGTEPPWLKCPGPADSTPGLHLRFRRQTGCRKQPALSEACMSLVWRGPGPPEFHTSQGQIIPWRASCQSPGRCKVLSRHRALLIPKQLRSGVSLPGPRVQIKCPFERARRDPGPPPLDLHDTRSRPSCRCCGRALPTPSPGNSTTPQAQGTGVRTREEGGAYPAGRLPKPFLQRGPPPCLGSAVLASLSSTS